MVRLSPLVLLLTILLSSCKDRSSNSIHDPSLKEHSKADTISQNTFAYDLEQRELAIKRNLCDKLGLYDLEKRDSGFELRIWHMPSMWEPHLLYILKQTDSNWTIFHYQYFIRHSPEENFQNSIIDSVVMETLKPQKLSWTTYIRDLGIDSLWDLQTESSIKDKSFGIVDGYVDILELNNKSRYKYLYFTEPEYFQSKDTNHRRYMSFKERLVSPLIYKGIRNP